MRRAAGIILIILGVSFLCFLIDVVVVFGITIFLAPFDAGIQGFIVGVFLLGLVVSAAIPITGGIFCLRRRYWEVCLASALLAAISSVLLPALLSYTSLSIIYTSMGWTIWVMLVAAVISVIFTLRTEKEWKEILA
jgi:hypothetical protein